MTYFKNLSLIVSILLFIHQSLEAQSQTSTEDDRYIVDLTAMDYAFAMPSEIKSGWVTFRFKNVGEEMHFGMILKFNDSVTQEGFNKFRENPSDSTFQKYIIEPPTVVGGPGFHAGGYSSETTLYLEPGSYAMVCNTETEEGEPHYSLGMEKYFKVSTEKAEATEPEASLNLKLKKYYLEANGSVKQGPQTISIDHDGDMFDVHLIRLEGASTIPATLNFMDHLKEPTNVLFAGGAEQKMIDGRTYVTIDIKAGDYAWVSHEYGAMGILKEFTIPENNEVVYMDDSERNAEIIHVKVESGKIQLPSQIKAGPVTFVLNDENPEMEHVIRMFRAEPGKTINDYVTYRKKRQQVREAGEGEVDMENPSLGYFPTFDKKDANGEQKLKLSLKPGNYGVVCFHRDGNDNWVHLLNGEYASFKVK